MKKNQFNLVEVIIAMGIVVVCITTIMGMFSVGMQISREATIKTYANIVFEQLGGFVETYPNAKEQIPTITSVVSGGYRYPDTTAYAQLVYKPTSGISATDHWTAGNGIKAAEDACDKNSSGVAIDSQDPFFKNVYYSSGATDGSKYALLKVEFQTTVNSSNVVDAVIWARLWFETDLTATAISTSDGGSVTLDQKLYIELTWPDKIPYNNRVLSGQILQKEWILEP